MSTETISDIDEIMNEVRAFLPRLLEACDATAEILYGVVDAHAWESIGDLVQGMDDLYRTMSAVKNSLDAEGSSDLLRTVIEDFLPDMANKFGEMNRYMDAEQFALAGDSLRYELLPVLSNLTTMLGEEDHIRRDRFNANMRYLKERFPRAYGQLNSQTRDAKRYQLTSSKDGSPNLCIALEGYDAFLLYSKYEPSAETDRWISSIEGAVEGKSNVMFYGLGFGYHLDAFLNAYPSANIYLYEPDMNILLSAMEVIDLASLFDLPQIKDLVVGQDKEQRDGLFYRMLKYVKGETATIALPVYDKLSTDWKHVFLNDAKNAIMNYASSENVYKKYGLEWTRNALYNMAYNISTPNINGLKGKFIGMPAVIVGAGPSLEADIELLRQLKQHALIIAAGSSIQSLLHFGIQPHLIVSMDGGVANYNVFRHVDITDIPLVYAPQVEYRVIDDTSKYLCHVYFNTDISTIYLVGLQDHDPVFRSSHSVTGTAIQTAAFLGCTEILFTGQDLSYPDDKVYASGAKHVGAGHNAYIMNKAVLEIENVHGGMNRTTESMRLTLIDIEEIISWFPENRFINMSKKGAKIKGTIWESVEEVLARHAENHVNPDIFKRAMQTHLKSYPELRKAQMCERVHSLPTQLGEFESKIRRVSRNMDKLLELARKNPEKCINKMVEIEQDWGTAVTSLMFNTFFIVILKQEVSRFDRDLPEVAAEQNLIKKASLFVEVLGTLIKEIEAKIPLIKDMVSEAVIRVNTKVSKDGAPNV